VGHKEMLFKINISLKIGHIEF